MLVGGGGVVFEVEGELLARGREGFSE